MFWFIWIHPHFLFQHFGIHLKDEGFTFRLLHHIKYLYFHVKFKTYFSPIPVTCPCHVTNLHSRFNIAPESCFLLPLEQRLPSGGSHKFWAEALINLAGAESHANSPWAGFELCLWLYSFSLHSSIQNNKEKPGSVRRNGGWRLRLTAVCHWDSKTCAYMSSKAWS